MNDSLKCKADERDENQEWQEEVNEQMKEMAAEQVDDIEAGVHGRGVIGRPKRVIRVLARFNE